MQNPRIIFAGTPEFARSSLSALVASDATPVVVLTQPDRRAGRGKRVTKSPVRDYAGQHDIPVLQPETLRDERIVAELQALQPDIMIVAAYGLLLPQNVLDIPRCGCLNVHASVLPRWRGAAPIQAAILADDKTSGVSLMHMTAGLDCGPVYCDKTVDIGEQETAGELHDRLASLGARLLVDNLQDILDGNLQAVAQNESLATYAGKIQTADAELDWRLWADELQRRVRAYNPVPGAYFYANVDAERYRVKCWQAEIVKGVSAEPGSIVALERDVVVACGTDALRLQSLQLPGKRRVSPEEFAGQIDLRKTQLSD